MMTPNAITALTAVGVYVQIMNPGPKLRVTAGDFFVPKTAFGIFNRRRGEGQIGIKAVTNEGPVETPDSGSGSKVGDE